VSIVTLLLKAFAIIGLFAVVAGVAGLGYFLNTGVSARPQPTAVETLAARTLRDIAIRRHAQHVENPVPKNDEALSEDRAHFADHCTSCHANDGSGHTERGSPQAS
jgi:hypothetical protein